MKRIRINNDIRVNLSVSRNGLPENFGNLTNIDGLTLLFRNLNQSSVQIIPASYVIDGGSIDMVITADQVFHAGKYVFIIQYRQVNVLNPDGYDTVTWDCPAFEIVNSTSQVGGTDPVVTYSVDLYAEIGIGLKGSDGATAFELWLAEPENTDKTYDQYWEWIREPATTAASEVDVLVDQVITQVNQAISATNQATVSAGNAADLAVEKAGLADTKAEIADTAASGANAARDGALAAIDSANTAKNDAISAADLAVEKAGLADTKATLANDKATLANNAAALANSKADLAVTATTNANNATSAALAAKDLANTAASNADTKATLANEKAGLANTAATNANQVAADIAEAEIERESYVNGIRDEFNYYRGLNTVFSIDSDMNLIANTPDGSTDDYSLNENGELIQTY